MGPMQISLALQERARAHKDAAQLPGDVRMFGQAAEENINAIFLEPNIAVRLRDGLLQCR